MIIPKLYIILFDFIVVVLISALYCSNRFWLKNVVNIPILSYLLKCYFNDYLAGIGIIAYMNLVLYVSKYRYIRIKTLSCAIVICFACGLLWEYILPQIFPHGTSDKWDVVSYVLGGVSYIEFFRGYQYRQMLRTVCELPSNI